MDWVVNVPCVLAIVAGYKTSFFTVVYTTTLLFGETITSFGLIKLIFHHPSDNFYFHQFWLYWNAPFQYEHVVYRKNVTKINTSRKSLEEWRSIALSRF